jgi:hypothetical protein
MAVIPVQSVEIAGMHNGNIHNRDNHAIKSAGPRTVQPVQARREPPGLRITN